MAIQEMAPAPLTALATMSAKDNKVLNQYGTVGVMLDMVLNPSSPSRVQADALQCVAQLVKTDVMARKQLVDVNGIDILFESRSSPYEIVRKRGLEVMEALLLRSDRDVLDRFSDHILVGICKYLTVKPREVAQSAGRLLMRLSRLATGDPPCVVWY